MFDVSQEQERLLQGYVASSFCDWILIDLWGKMQRSGDLEKTFLSGSQTLLSFMKILAKPETRFAYDQDGPYFCAWCEPVMAGVALGFWVREDKRKSRICLTLAHQLFAELFQGTSTVVVITKDPSIKLFHEHFGFEHLGSIPSIYDGDPAYISYLTRETYTAKLTSRRNFAHG